MVSFKAVDYYSVSNVRVQLKRGLSLLRLHWCRPCWGCIHDRLHFHFDVHPTKEQCNCIYRRISLITNTARQSVAPSSSRKYVPLRLVLATPISSDRTPPPRPKLPYIDIESLTNTYTTSRRRYAEKCTRDSMQTDQQMPPQYFQNYTLARGETTLSSAAAVARHVVRSTP